MNKEQILHRYRRLEVEYSYSARDCLILNGMTQEIPGVDESLLESAAQCLDAESVRALGEIQLGDTAKSRLDLLAQKANEGQRRPADSR